MADFADEVVERGGPAVAAVVGNRAEVGVVGPLGPHRLAVDDRGDGAGLLADEVDLDVLVAGGRRWIVLGLDRWAGTEDAGDQGGGGHENECREG